MAVTFRDYAQGAYRMRGISLGQRINVLLVPEVEELMRRAFDGLELDTSMPRFAGADAKDAAVLEQITCWLTMNALHSEAMQSNFQMQQNLANLYRRNSLMAHMLPAFLNKASFPLPTTSALDD